MTMRNVRQVPLSRIIERLCPGTVFKAMGNGNLKCLSPFTKEKHASFFVYTDTNSFKCYSSGYSGNNIFFVMKYLHVSGSEAVNWIAGEFDDVPLVWETVQWEILLAENPLEPGCVTFHVGLFNGKWVEAALGPKHSKKYSIDGLPTRITDLYCFLGKSSTDGAGMEMAWSEGIFDHDDDEPRHTMMQFELLDLIKELEMQP